MSGGAVIASRDARVPVGVDAGRWVTVAAERTVLVAARTVTSAARALDAVALFRDDPRVQVVFAVNDTSPFVDGVRELLSLPEPPTEVPIHAWPEPQVEGVPVHSYAVSSRRSPPDTIDVQRIPAAVDVGALDSADGWLRHLAVDERERDLRLVQSASVLVREEPAEARELAAAWASGALDRLPGARLAGAATEDGCLVVLRDGRRVHVSAPDAGGCAVMLAVSCVYTLLRTGGLAATTVRLRLGDDARTYQLRIVPA